MAMDPRKLLYLATVIECGSLKKAAGQLEISQPALSTSMDRFEKSLGEKLLKRSSAGVTPTSLGKLLYAHARLIREELERADRRVTEPLDRAEDAIAFGTLPSLATSIVPSAVCRWREKHDKTTLRVVERNQLELLLTLLRGEVDFIIAQTECFGFVEGMMQRVLFRDRLHIMARSDHPILKVAAPSWADLAEFPWVSQMVARSGALLKTLLASKNVSLPLQLTECGSVDFIKATVAASDSLALLPASAVATDVREGKLVPLDIDEPLLNRDIAVLFRDGAPLNPASRELLAHLEAAGLNADSVSRDAWA